VRTIAVIEIAAVIALGGCGKNGASSPPPPSSNSSVSSDDPATRPNPVDAAVINTASPDDHAASARAIFDATNYVAPAELAWSRKLGVVIYPGCGGGEGPGESCSLGALDKAGKTVELPEAVRVSWSTGGRATDEQRATAIAQMTKAFDTLDTFRLDRTPWKGAALDVPGFGRIEYDAKAKMLIATAEGRTSRVPLKAHGDGGPVNVYAAAAAPVAVVQSRFNPTSGGTEGYVVFIDLNVVPKP
jgi:hypothetical protein